MLIFDVIMDVRYVREYDVFFREFLIKLIGYGKNILICLLFIKSKVLD